MALPPAGDSQRTHADQSLGHSPSRPRRLAGARLLPGSRGRADESAYRPGSVVALLRRATIHLRLPLPTASSGLPAGSGGPPSNACAVHQPKPADLLTLLQVGFTEPRESPRPLVVSYTTVSPLLPRTPTNRRPESGLFSVALSRGSPRVGVTHHLALWSPDLPRHAPKCATRSPGRLVRRSGNCRGSGPSEQQRAGRGLGRHQADVDPLAQWQVHRRTSRTHRRRQQLHDRRRAFSLWTTPPSNVSPTWPPATPSRRDRCTPARARAPGDPSRP